jgi:hypothetical protein
MSFTQFITQLGAAGAGGESFWIAKYAGSRNDEYINGIDVDSSGNIYCTGQSATNPYNNATYLKVDPDGTLNVSKDVGRSGTGNPDNDFFNNCFLNSDGDLITCGQSVGGSGTTIYAPVVKISGDAFSTAASVNGTQIIQTVRQDSSGNVHTLSDYGQKIGLTKMNAALSSRVWQAEFAPAIGNNGMNRMDMAIDSNGNVYVVGSVDNNTYNRDIAYLFKANSSGVRQWDRTLREHSPVNHCRFNAVACDSNDNVFVVGYLRAVNEYFVGKYNSSGSLLAAKNLSGLTQSPTQVAIDSSNNVYVGGYDGGGPSTGDSPYIIKLNNGLTTVDWARRIDRAVDIRSQVLAIDANDNVYVGGTDAEQDYFLAKLPSDGSGTGTYSNYSYTSFSCSSSDATDLDDSVNPMFNGSSGSMNNISTSTPSSIPFSNRSLTETKDTLSV